MYNKEKPFIAKVKERSALCKPGSGKNTQHIVLDLTGSGIQYEVGDSIAILPKHDKSQVEKTLSYLKASGNETILHNKTGQPLLLQEYLEKEANIAETSRKLFRYVVDKHPDTVKRGKLSKLLEKENRTLFKQYLEQNEVWQFLEEHPEISIQVSDFVNLLQPLLPRFYSIASSQKVYNEEVHLTVAMVEYEANGWLKRGVCSHFLCNLTKTIDAAVPIYVQPHTGFTLPKDSSQPIIMIGPGTGIAPFRAFMQERMATGAEGKNWLFFGERYSTSSFYYQEFWKNLELQGKLKLDAAFSRDQEEKIYVQHRMLQNKKEFFRWLEEGAIIYVCGDKNHMAKDVDETLHHIIAEEGGLDQEGVKEYVKALRKSGRYLRDVY